MEQIEWMASLRGTAVLLVFASHQYWGIDDDGLNQVLGRSGVAIFLLMAASIVYLLCRIRLRDNIYGTVFSDYTPYIGCS